MTNDPDYWLQQLWSAKSLSDRLASQQIATLRLHDFVRVAWARVEGSRPLEWGWHLDAICKHLEALVDGRLGTRNLLVNVPPRTSKSTIVTVMFPCWLWTFRPQTQFIFASYSFDLSRDHAYKRRAIIESEWYAEAWGEIVQLATDRNNIAEVANTARGLFVTTSVKGTVTGKGGDYKILDDPNDAEQMESEVERASTLRWIDINWSTRANDPKTVREIVIQQRTHTDDVTGHVLKQNASAWCHLKIPMERGEKSCVTSIWTDSRTSKGELLQPQRFDAAYVALQKLRLGPYFYAGQYDQEPYPLGGGIFKSAWFGKWAKSETQPGSIAAGIYGAIDPWRMFRFTVVDPAITMKTIGEKKVSDPDYTVIYACMAFSTPQGALLCIMDMVRERLEGPGIIKRLKAMQATWRFAVIGVETVAFQLALFQFARKDGLPVREISTKKDPEALYTIDTDKVARAVGATPFTASGRCYIPEYAPWCGDFLAEVCAFPNAAHDDTVDALAFACAIAEKYIDSDATAPRSPEPARAYPDYNDSRTRDTELDPLAGFGVDGMPAL